MEYSVCTCDFALWRLIPKDILYNLNRKKTPPKITWNYSCSMLHNCAACKWARNNRQKNPKWQWDWM